MEIFKLEIIYGEQVDANLGWRAEYLRMLLTREVYRSVRRELLLLHRPWSSLGLVTMTNVLGQRPNSKAQEQGFTDQEILKL